MPFNGKVIIHDELVRQKLLMAAPRILESNRLMVKGMLDWVKADVQPQTPTGPGHFGYHGRDTFKVEVSSSGVKTTGRLKAAAQIYWREFGTRGRFRGRSGRSTRSALTLMAGLAIGRSGNAGLTGGEKAGLYATHALTGARQIIKNFYGKAQWWRL